MKKSETSKSEIRRANAEPESAISEGGNSDFGFRISNF